MRYLIPLLIVIAIPTFAAEELESIFNGKDLDGWNIPDPNTWWTVENGVLIGNSNDAMKGHVLETKKTYTDVIVEAEVRWQGEIDSGIFLRKGQKWQLQFGVSRSLKKDMTGSVFTGKYSAIAQNVEKFFKTGDWNKFRIEARGPSFKVWLNGEQILDSTDDRFPDAGPIGLQVHPGLKMKVEYRNLKAKALEPAPVEKKLKCEAGRFEITAPVGMTDLIGTIRSGEEKIKCHQFLGEAGPARLFRVTYVDAAKDSFVVNQPEKTLDACQKDYAKGTELTNATLESHAKITLEGYPGRELVLHGQSGELKVKMKTRLFIADTRLYTVSCTAPVAAPDEEMDRFLASFKLLKN